MAQRNSFSIEDVLDEDNRAALAEVGRVKSDSPSRKRAGAPRSTASVGADPLTAVYVGNRLGVTSPNIRHSSIAGDVTGVTSPSQSRKKRLDPSDPSTWTRAHVVSPTEDRPRSRSENIEREGPTITLDSQDGGDQEGAIGGGLTNEEAVATEPETPATPMFSAATLLHDNEDEDQTSPSTVPIDSPVTPASPQHLALPEGDGARRFSQQSASFSTMTDDSDIGAIKDEVAKGDDNVVEEYSDTDRSDSDEGSPVARRGRKRGSDVESKSQEQTKQVERNEAATPPQIKVDEADDKSRKPHEPDHSGKLSETKSETITPQSNFQRASSTARSTMGDEDAELKRAKALELRVSPLDETVKERTVKMIIRGDWNSFQDYEDEDQHARHEPRLYLVCTDLSHEATYALEWTVGTLLKDGDTLLIINAVEDENASKAKDFEVEPTLEVKLESAKAAEEANDTMTSLTRQTTKQQSDAQYEASRKAKLAALKDSARSLSRTGRNWSKKDEERVKAIDKLENDFLKFVRKTTLQVRCMIEVIHCRNSRHLILSAIDGLEPTLVVVGTRGQGSVKNVLMGSFSNYLVQKSSIPVMVARKRLKKPHHAKISSQQIRMTNNLMPSLLHGKRTSLAKARID